MKKFFKGLLTIIAAIIFVTITVPSYWIIYSIARPFFILTAKEIARQVNKWDEKDKKNIDREYHVIKSGHMWAVKLKSNIRATRVFHHKGNAVDFAVSKNPGRIIVHNPDGSVEKTI